MMRPPKRYAYNPEPASGISFGKLISYPNYGTRNEMVLDDQAATQKRDIHIRMRKEREVL